LRKRVQNSQRQEILSDIINEERYKTAAIKETCRNEANFLKFYQNIVLDPATKTKRFNKISLRLTYLCLVIPGGA